MEVRQELSTANTICNQKPSEWRKVFGRSAPSGRSGQGRRPARRAGRRLSMGPPPAEGGRRPHKKPPTRVQKLFASSWYNPIFRDGLSFWAAPAPSGAGAAPQRSSSHSET